mgnify:CR=1 FL=1
MGIMSTWRTTMCTCEGGDDTQDGELHGGIKGCQVARSHGGKNMGVNRKWLLGPS